MSLNVSSGNVIDPGGGHLKLHNTYSTLKNKFKKKIFVWLGTSGSYLTPNFGMGG